MNCAKTDSSVSELMSAYFCRIADTLGLPRSAALIYYVLYVSEEPLCFAEIVSRTGLSKASGSTGLKLLERMRGVEQVLVPHDRRSFYRAELSVLQILSGFVAANLKPGLDAGVRILDEAQADADDLSPLLAERLTNLCEWHQKASDLVPLLGRDGSA